MGDNFSVLVLDDWHWGDAASVELWSRLDDTTPMAGGRVAWIVAYRSAQLPKAALERQRADLDSRRGVAVALEGMDESEVLELTRALSGAGGGRLFSQPPAWRPRATRSSCSRRATVRAGLLTADANGWSTPYDEHTQATPELPVPNSVRDAVPPGCGVGTPGGAPAQWRASVPRIDARLLAR
jgi:hypothetical protein